MTTVPPSTALAARRLPVGVELTPEGVHARVWAPRCRRVDVVLADDGAVVPLEREPGGDGYFSGIVPGAGAGTRYSLRLDGARRLPDPVSRFQPEGPHGPSQIVDPGAYAWRDAKWRGLRLADAVIYELHVGTFTPEGSYRAAIEKLPHLAGIGVTAIELMPVCEFPGRFGWGYDGVDLFAPTRLYGTPDDLRALVDAAHGAGIGVLLDVVYNHFGPDGNYLRELSDWYFKGQTEWGEAIDFDGPQSAPVRELFLANARYWVEEFHVDGLRLDATQQIFDETTPHILAEIVRAVREAGERLGGRGTIVVGENEPQKTSLLRPVEEGGCGLDALWNDDLHHSARVAATGRSEAYYSGYTGSAQELVSAAKYGYLYQGQWYPWQGQRRGTPAFDIPSPRFIAFTQNHDQVANAANGQRLHQLTSPGRYRALMALTLLLPQTPMLFQGQEWAASTPFLYFADHHAELARLVRRGRREFLGQFPSVATAEVEERLHDPADPRTFARCTLDWRERDAADGEGEGTHAAALALVRDLLALRRDDATLRWARESRLGDDREAGARMAAGRTLDGAVLGDDAFLLRFFGAEGPGSAGDRLLVVNLGRRLRAEPLAEPLAAPPRERRWRVRWSSEDPRYGGGGTPAVDPDDGAWWLPAECAVLMEPVAPDAAPPARAMPLTEKQAREQWTTTHHD